jgi:hypothetical protein
MDEMLEHIFNQSKIDVNTPFKDITVKDLITQIIKEGCAYGVSHTHAVTNTGKTLNISKDAIYNILVKCFPDRHVDGTYYSIWWSFLIRLTPYDYYKGTFYKRPVQLDLFPKLLPQYCEFDVK